MNRREFHQTVAATAATLAVRGSLSPAVAAASVPLTPDPLPVGAVARLGCNRLWHQWPASNPGLSDLTFSPDGRYLATLGAEDDHLFIWSLPDGRPVRDWEPQLVDRGGNLLWTEKGLYIATSGGLSLWEPLSATLIHRFTDDPMRGLARSPDGRCLAATTFTDGEVQTWDVLTQQPLAKLFILINGKRRTTWDDFLLSVSFSRCGRWLAAGGYHHGPKGEIVGCIHCWDLTSRRHLIGFAIRGGPVGKLAYTSTGQLLTGDWFGNVALWEVPEGRLVRSTSGLLKKGIFHSLAVNVSGQIAVQRENGVYRWHPNPEREALLCPAHGFPHLAYSNDGRFVAVGAYSGRVELYDTITKTELSPPNRHKVRVDNIELTADGAICLSFLRDFQRNPNSEDETVLRDTHTGARLLATPPPTWQPLALAPVGTRIAGRQGESRLIVWDWVSGQTWGHPEISPRTVAWHPDGQTLLITGENGTVLTWEPTTGQEKRQPVTSSARFMAVALAESRAVALNEAGELFVWRLDRPDPPRCLSLPAKPTNRDCWPPAQRPLALAPDGKSIAVTYGNGVVYTGSVRSKKLRAVYTHPLGDRSGGGDHSTIDGVHYTPAGRLLLTGLDTVLRDHDWWYMNFVMDGLRGKMLWRSSPQQFSATAQALTLDGKRLFTGYDDGTLLIWPLDPEKKGG